MSDRDVLLALTQRLLAAPGDDQGWRAFLLELCDAIHGSAANFISHDFRAIRASVTVAARTDPEALDFYQQHWHRFDPWANSFEFTQATGGDVVLGDRLIAEAAMRREAFYNDFARRYDIFQCVAGIIEVGPQGYSCLSINGSERRTPFGEREAALLRALMPHLQRAIALHRRLIDADQRAAELTAAIDTVTHSVFLVTSSGHVRFANRAAEALLRAADGLWLDRHELRAAGVAETQRLRSAIAASFRLDMTDTESAFLLERPSGKRPYTVLVAPVVPRDALLAPDRVSSMVIVTDPDTMASAAPADRLRRCFGLTDAETRLAVALLGGDAVEAAADRLGITVNTARTQLRHVFQKTHTRRQSELLRVLLTVAALAPADR